MASRVGGSRGWPTRGLYDPPYWGRALPDSWLTHEVTFYRTQQVPDGHGGWKSGGAPTAYLTTPARVWWAREGEPMGPYDLGLAVVTRRLLRMVVPMQAGDLVPRKGDFVEWTDDLSRKYRLSVRHVHSPMAAGSHLEVETDAWTA